MRHFQRRAIATVVLVFGVGTTSAFSVEPPACTDKVVSSDLRRAYQALFVMDDTKKKQKYRIEDVKEVGYADPPRGLNQYAPSRDYYNKSRYCEAKVVTDSGETELAYARIDGRKDPAVKEYNFAPCFIKHSTLSKDCGNERLKK
jgi:hypothetical protein